MFNLVDITNENNKKDNKKLPFIRTEVCLLAVLDQKTNALLNLISLQDDIDKIYLHAKNLSEPKYGFLIKRCENAGIKHLSDPNALIMRSDTIDDVYENIDDYNQIRKRKILIVFDDTIADIRTNKKIHAIIKELFIRCRKLNI